MGMQFDKRHLPSGSMWKYLGTNRASLDRVCGNIIRQKVLSLGVVFGNAMGQKGIFLEKECGNTLDPRGIDV